MLDKRYYYMLYIRRAWEMGGQMRIDIVGYNRFEYTNKAGESKTGVKFFCLEYAPSGKITDGLRTFEVFSSPSYAQKITEGFEAGKEVHIGWGAKDKRAFLYLR